jgi:hypothetical protein
MSNQTGNHIRVLFVACYMLVAFSATLYHPHDSDAYAGYDEHCTSCIWTNHTPISISAAYKISCSLTTPEMRSFTNANPSDVTAFTRRTGRSPPQFSS